MPLGFYFLIYFLAEIWMLVEIGSVIGGFSTVLWIIISALWGAYLLRGDRLIRLMTLRQSWARHQLPEEYFSEEMVTLLGNILGGFLLFLPGFISDFVGLFLIFPPTQYFASRWLSQGLRTSFRPMRDDGDIIEGEIIEHHERIHRE